MRLLIVFFYESRTKSRRWFLKESFSQVEAGTILLVLSGLAGKMLIDEADHFI